MEYAKVGFAGFASDTISAGIGRLGISIGLKGVSNSVFASVGDMAGDAAMQYILTGKVDPKEMIVSGLANFGCSEYSRLKSLNVTPKSLTAISAKAQGTGAYSFSKSGASGFKDGTKNLDNVVYLSKNADGAVQYVGITNNLARREAEHLASKGIQIRELMTRLSRTDARSVEQALIEIHGLGKNGGTLLNKINSISQKNPIYAESLQQGYELLKSMGYQ